jgi:hypothetical protein
MAGCLGWAARSGAVLASLLGGGGGVQRSGRPGSRGGCPPAAGTLRSHVSRLRTLLKPDAVLIAQGRGYALAVEPGQQEVSSHADLRTTMRYDRARTSLDRHATCIVAADVAGAAGNDWPLSTTPPAQAQRPGGGPRHDVMKHHPQ